MLKSGAGHCKRISLTKMDTDASLEKAVQVYSEDEGKFNNRSN